MKKQDHYFVSALRSDTKKIKYAAAECLNILEDPRLIGNNNVRYYSFKNVDTSLIIKIKSVCLSIKMA